MTQIPGKYAITSAHAALEEALTSLQIATLALENTPNPQPWSRERLNHAHAQDLLKHTQQRVDNLYSK